METNQYLIDYYNTGKEDNRLLSRHGQVEFLTTMRYIEKYINPGDCILEVGAATGRYSHTLARQGYKVDAVELVEHNIEIFKANTQSGEQVTVRQGDARDLCDFTTEEYDITLILGPLYHLYTVEDKREVIHEALRVTKPGGIVFAAHCICDGAIFNAGFKRKKFDVAEYIKKGLIDPITFDTKSGPKDLFELVRKEDIDEIMSIFSVERLHYIATDLYAEHIGEELAEMNEETFALYMRYHFAVCEREDLLGITSHVVDIFRK
jgi:SAM-dependent methyltransferase